MSDGSVVIPVKPETDGSVVNPVKPELVTRDPESIESTSQGSTVPEPINSTSQGSTTHAELDVDNRFLIDVVSKTNCLPDEKKDRTGRCQRKQV